MTSRQRRNLSLTMESLESRTSASTVPVVLTTMSLAFVPVSTVLMQQPKSSISPVPAGKETLPYLDTVPTPTKPLNDWIPPLDTSPVPLVPGGPR